MGGRSGSGGALIGVGSATIAVCAGGLALSGVRRKRAKREPQRLEPQIKSLRSALDSGTEQRRQGMSGVALLGGTMCDVGAFEVQP